jgi:ABC-2 type transport system ATP-binding protein
MNAAAVEVRSLVHAYGSREALAGVDLTVESGGMFALLGPNGGGKTTLFRILATLLKPTRGSARIFDLDVVADAAAVRRRIGVVFQSPSLDRKLTVAENLLHQGHLYGLRGPDLRRRRDAVLSDFSLTDRADDRVETLSGGLARRVELAKGLLHEPELLLLDEPGTGLDPGARRDLADRLGELADARNVTVLLTTHITDEADRCDRICILNAGRIVAEGAPDRLRDEIGGDCVTIATQDADALAGRIAERFGTTPTVVDGLIRIERDRGHELVPQLVEAFPGEITSVTVSKPTLEDVFIHHTGRRLWDDAADTESA